MTITKNVSFKSPYTAMTFQNLAASLVGGDGYLSGAAASDNGTVATVGPYSFVQRGIVVGRDDNTTGIAVPTAAEPWFLLAGTLDDDIASGVQMVATADVSQIGTGVVLAFKVDGQWFNPVAVSPTGALAADAGEPGRETGFALRATVSGSNFVDIVANRGVIVDPDGRRRELSRHASAGSQTFEQALFPGLKNARRTDYLALRQTRTVGGGAVALIGDAVGAGMIDDTRKILYPMDSAYTAATVGLQTGAGVKKPVTFVPRGTLVSHRAWGNSTALRIGSWDEAASAVVYATATLPTGGGNIDSLSFAGQRSSDGALVLFYTDGNDLKVVAYDPATGLRIDNAVTVDTQPNAIVHAHATMGVDGFAYVVYQHDEGGAAPNQQIYWARVVIATGGAFGTTPIGPVLANEVASAKEDTWPTIGTTGDGRVHIAYITGNGSDEFGELRYVVISAAGTVESKTTYSSYGWSNGDPYGPTGLVDGVVVAPTYAKPTLVVNAHDDVHVFMIGYDDVGPRQAVVFSPSFVQRFPATMPILWLDGLFSVTGDDVTALAATVDDMGQMYVGVNFTSAGLRFARLDTVIAPRGVLGDGYLETDLVLDATIGAATEVSVHLYFPGTLAWAYLGGTTATLLGSTRRYTGAAFTPHPRDVYLGSWVLSRSNGPPKTYNDLHLFNTRSKRLNHPFLVGDEGDFVGVSGLYEAVAEANKRGGMIIARGGTYRIGQPLVIYSGVQLIAEGILNLHIDGDLPNDAINSNWITLGAHATDNTCTITTPDGGATYKVVLGTAVPRYSIKPGDIVEPFASGTSNGTFRVMHVESSTVFYVDGNFGAPTGANTIRVYSAGIRLEGVHVREASGNDSTTLLLNALFDGRVVNFTPWGTINTGYMVRMNRCQRTMIDGLDLSKASTSVIAAGVYMVGGLSNTIRNARIGGFAYEAAIKIDPTELRPRLEFCFPARDTRTLLVVDPTRAAGEYIYALTSRGIMSGADADLAKVVAWADADSTAFNGAKPGMLTASVNERFIKAGDTGVADGNKGDVNTVPWRVKPIPASNVAAVTLEDSSGNVSDEVDQLGHWLSKGYRFLEDFDPADCLDQWSQSFGGTGTATFDSEISAVKLNCPNNTDTTQLSLVHLGDLKRDDRPRFRARLALTGALGGAGDIAERADIIGINNIMFFRRDTSAGDSNWMLVIKVDDLSDISAADIIVDLGVAPTRKVYQYMVFAVLDAQHVYWRVGTDPVTPVAQGVVDLSAVSRKVHQDVVFDTTLPYAQNGSFSASNNDKTMYIDLIECFTATRHAQLL